MVDMPANQEKITWKSCRPLLAILNHHNPPWNIVRRCQLNMISYSLVQQQRVIDDSLHRKCSTLSPPNSVLSLSMFSLQLDRIK